LVRRAQYHRPVLLRFFVAVTLMTASLAWAQVPTAEHHACDNARGDVEPADQEKACSMVIQLGGSKNSLAVAYSNRGQSFMRRRAYDKAIEDYGQAIALDPRLVAAYRNRGAAYFISESYDEALPDYDAAIRLMPDEPGGYADRCSVRVMTGKPKEAKVDCDKAIDLDSWHGPAHAWRALAHLQLGNLSAADQDVTRIMHEYPNDPSVRYLQGIVLEAKGEKIEAERQFGAARELSAEDFARLDRIYGRFRKR
jgi:tetratricopeptide (TPR) repeat protein